MRPKLKVLLASPRGFCAGVDRAIQIVERAIAKYGAPVYVRHEIVHNRHVVDRLRAVGAVFVEELEECPDDRPVVFSAHGVPKSVPAEADPAPDDLSRRHLPAGLQGARRGRAPPRRRPRDRADRPCRPPRGGGHARPAAGRRGDADPDRRGGRGLHAARSGQPRLRHPDHAVARRHRRDGGGAAPPLPGASPRRTRKTSATPPPTARRR